MSKNIKSTEEFLQQYATFKNPNIRHRYVSWEMLQPELKELSDVFEIKNEGHSVLNNPIDSVAIGNGPIKILAWSQMHGNESTTTKAVLDILNFLASDNEAAFSILKNCSIKIIPMLNPDGAKAYTRVNANAIDLNRDAQHLQEPESRLLRKIYNEFQPDFCLNLHDQRTIFSAGTTKNPATLSFLAPAMDQERSINQNRKLAMQVIAKTAAFLEPFLKSKIGRYDDAFNINCTGDTFMALGVPTILFEAGHYPNDYEREETRKYTALAIFSTLKIIAERLYEDVDFNDYEKIPENQKLFYDVILRNANINGEIMDVGIQFREELEENHINFVPIVAEIAKMSEKSGHQEIECNGENLFSISKNPVKENDVAYQILLGDRILSIKSR